MRIVPINQKDANRFVREFHRHHRPVVGSIFQIACKVGEDVVGVAICGRPVAPKVDHTKIIEVDRLCVKEGFPNVCSKLYGASARIAKEMGYHKIVTFTLDNEIGTSLRASGWIDEGIAGVPRWTGKRQAERDAKKQNGLFGSTVEVAELPNQQMKIKWSKGLKNKR